MNEALCRSGALIRWGGLAETGAHSHSRFLGERVRSWWPAQRPLLNGAEGGPALIREAASQAESSPVGGNKAPGVRLCVHSRKRT